MPDSYVRCTVNFPGISGLPTDTQVNVLHFRGQSMSAATAAALIDSRMATWLAVIDGYCTSTFTGTPATLHYYDLTDAIPRTPILTTTHTLTRQGGDALPPQIAQVLSFQGTHVSGVNQGRRRGRIYLPTTVKTSVTMSGGLVLWTTGIISDIKAGASALLAGTIADATPWSVFSQVTYADTADYDLSFITIHDGWLDNAPDVHRSRRQASSTRNTWT